MIKFRPFNFGVLMILVTSIIISAESISGWLIIANLVLIFLNAMTSFVNVLEEVE